MQPKTRAENPASKVSGLQPVFQSTLNVIVPVMWPSYRPASEGALRVISHEQEVGRTLATQNRVLLAYVRRRSATAGDAEDVAQEAIVRVLVRARETLIADPLSYAMRAARNILIDRARRSANVQIDDLDEADHPVDGQATPLEALDMNERLKLCQRALEAMPPLRREVFVRRRAGEESYETIARELKLSIEAVQKHYSRAAQTLRRTAEGRHVE